jgi:uncharacterized protein (TIGR00369 family)
MLILNPEYVEAVCNLANTCPYFRLLSMTIKELDIGRAVVEIDLDDKHIQAFGVVHGGVVASVIDTAAFWAVFCELEENAGITSVDININYLAPVQSGKLLATGRRIKLGSTIGLAEADIINEDGKMIAHGTSTIMVLPDRGLAGGESFPPKFIEDAVRE